MRKPAVALPCLIARAPDLLFALFAASGFILGKVMGDPLGWRAPFAAISVAMIPFVVFCAVAEPISLRGLSPAAPRPRSPAPGSSADADGDATGCVPHVWLLDLLHSCLVPAAVAV